jgi:hypothetical protein
MKKAQMKAGELYGYTTGTSEYRSPVPMIVLDVGQLWTWNRSGVRDERKFMHSRHSRPRSAPGGFSFSYSGDDGYLAIQGYRHGDDADQAAAITAMRALWEEFEATDRGAEDVNALARKVKDVQGVSLEIVNNRWIEGPWEAALKAEIERQEARDAERDADRAERNRKRANIVALNDELARRGYTSAVAQDHGAFGERRVTIEMPLLADLLGVTLKQKEEEQ